MRLIRGFHISSLFIWILTGIAVLFVGGFVFSPLFYLGQGLLALMVMLLLLDTIFLFAPKIIVTGSRKIISPANLGDENPVKFWLTNQTFIPIRIRVYDEAPDQLVQRNLFFKDRLSTNETKQFKYSVKPNERGLYQFNDINVFVKSFFGLVERREIISAKEAMNVYPSILQMKKYELMVFKKTAQNQGIKKIRRLGHNNEFEQIKNYVQGDDIRTINWKATSRRNELMINQYQDERSQNVYSVIDKSRTMKMPFNEMTLLDYSINATLAFSNISIKKGDKAGLLTFSDKIGAQLKAERSSFQLRKILESLYSQKTHFSEASFELLYYSIRKTVKGRSLIMLYTNFESEYALRRALPILRKINKQHLLVVIFFENTAIEELQGIEAMDTKDIYMQTLAEKEANEKRSYVQELGKYGIQAVLSTPEKLTVDAVNKYLEIKSKGMI